MPELPKVPESADPESAKPSTEGNKKDAYFAYRVADVTKFLSWIMDFVYENWPCRRLVS